VNTNLVIGGHDLPTDEDSPIGHSECGWNEVDPAPRTERFV
jgi:hypothetical protein